METKTGMIENVNFTEGDNNKGHWKRMAYRIDGGMYSTFDDKLHGFTAQQYVKIGFTKQGNFNNINSIEKAALSADAAVIEEHIGGNDAAQVTALQEIVGLVRTLIISQQEHTVQLKRIADGMRK